MVWINLSRLGLGLFLSLLFSHETLAAEYRASNWHNNGYAQVRIINGGKTSESARLLGLEFSLTPKWHIYWRNPGAAGLPPKIDWQGSTNIESVMILWPAPSRLVQFGLDSFIYEGRVTLPLLVKLKDERSPARLKLALSYAACSDICIPYQARLELPISPTRMVSDRDMTVSDSLDQAMARLPKLMTAQSLGMTNIEIASDNQGENFLHFSLPESQGRGITDILVDGDGFAGLGLTPRFVTRAETTRVEIPLVGSDAAGWRAQALNPGLTLTLLQPTSPSQLRAIELTVKPPLVEHRAAYFTLSWQLALMVLLALVGGLILNLMPCVLPVLSFKIIGAVQQVGRERLVIRRQFLATAAGVLSCFLVLALVVVGLRQFGMTLGWGGQFQQPIFLGGMVLILVVLGLNLLGLFRIILPQRLAAWSQLESSHPTVSAYLSGVFATVLATPCTAPVVGL